MAGLVSNQNLIPTVKWHQNKEYLFLNFEVYDSKNQDIKITNQDIYFFVQSNNQNYEMNFEFLNEIDKDNSNYTLLGNSIKVNLKKMNQENWSSLTKNKNLYKNNIRVDWNAYVNDLDDEEEVEPQNNEQFDFNKMMQGMQGMNNTPDNQQFDFHKMMESMQGMDINDNEESMLDDEDLEGMPDLDNEEDFEDMPDEDEEEYCHECSA
jgi:hypothetical protein